MTVYILFIMECTVIILEYGFVPRGSRFNNFTILTQSLLRYIQYIFICYVIFHDALKLTKRKLTRASTIILLSVFGTCLVYTLAVMIYGFIERFYDRRQEYCTSSSWVLIKSSHFAISLIIMVIGFIITRYVQKVLRDKGYEITIKQSKPLLALWVIIIASFIDSFLELLIEVLFATIRPAN